MLAVRGGVLRERREAAGLNQRDLAFEIRKRFPAAGKVSGEQIGQYEREQLGQSRPNLMLLAAIAAVLDCRVDELAPGAEEQIAQVMALLGGRRPRTGSRCKVSADSQAIAA